MKNKKGFTLIELLAVIVILALLIVVVANTAIPAMNRARKNSLVVYAQRVQERAKEVAMAQNVTSAKYSIKDLMGEDSQYEGYVVISQNSTTQALVATITIRDKKNNLLLSNTADFDATGITSSSADIVIGDTSSVE